MTLKLVFVKMAHNAAYIMSIYVAFSLPTPLGRTIARVVIQYSAVDSGLCLLRRKSLRTPQGADRELVTAQDYCQDEFSIASERLPNRPPLPPC